MMFLVKDMLLGLLQMVHGGANVTSHHAHDVWWLDVQQPLCRKSNMPHDQR